MLSGAAGRALNPGMKRILILLALVVPAGCATEPVAERLEVRHLAAGEAVMPGLICVSVEVGTPVRVVLRNERDEARTIVWFPRWRTNDGFVVKVQEKVRELRVPANGEAAIVAQPPVGEAKQFEFLIGDRP